MADGDAASAIGLAIMNGLEKVKDVWKHVNATRDMIAAHITGGSHAASAITSGTLSVDRIPVLTDAKIPSLAGSKITSAVSRATGSDGPHAAGVAGAGPYYSVWVDGAHDFKRNTSSRRYKKNIRNLPLTVDQFAGLKPRLFDRHSGISNEPGFIAEEVLELVPQVVTYWWETDENGKAVGDREVDGLRYDVLGALGVAALAREVLALRKRLDRLEGKS